jgi:hypothetical protein
VSTLLKQANVVNSVVAFLSTKLKFNNQNAQLINGNMSEFPSIPEQANNLVSLIQDAIMDAISGNEIFATDEEKDRRLSICRSCPEYHAESIRCKNCGCFLENKVIYTAAKCPLDKWVQP